MDKEKKTTHKEFQEAIDKTELRGFEFGKKTLSEKEKLLTLKDYKLKFYTKKDVKEAVNGCLDYLEVQEMGGREIDSVVIFQAFKKWFGELVE